MPTQAERIGLTVQLGMTIDLGLTITHAAAPQIAALPLEGSEIAQVSFIVISGVVFVELLYQGARVYQAIREWWTDSRLIR